MKKKIIISISAILIIGSILLIIDSPEKEGMDKATDETITVTTQDSITDKIPTNKAVTDDSPDMNKQDLIKGNIYETKISDTESQTMYFGLDSKLTVYFFENDLVRSEMFCTYELSDNADTIIIYYPEGDEANFKFKIESDGKYIHLNDQKYKKSKKTNESIFDG